MFTKRLKDEGRRMSGHAARQFHPSSFILQRLHADESGSISLATVFALLLLTMLLGMVINTGRQVDNKIKLQNAADAATYSGGVVLARGMNSLAFTNHMLTEVFALTAFMREARDRHADPFIPDILAAWDRIGPVLGSSGFQKFDQLGPSIPQKTQAEQQMVTAYGNWMAASSEVALPVLEEILAQEMIPQLQRQIVAITPGLAQTAAASIANRNTGRPSPRDQPRGAIVGVLWRTMMVDPVGGASESVQGTLPAIDPATDLMYLQQAVAKRNTQAEIYLKAWNYELMRPFDLYAKMSQFSSLWQGFTCGQLHQLFDQYPTTNLPHLIREDTQGLGQQQWLENEYMFVGVAYRPKLVASMSRLFTDSLQSDNEAFTQGMLFVPRRRPVDIGWYWDSQLRIWRPGFIKDGVPEQWDLWNENWSFQLVPATAASLTAILQTQPQTPAAAGKNLRLPNLQGVSPQDVQQITTH